MRRGILGVRKQISLYGGVGFSGRGRFKIKRKGMQKRKTVCGHKINDSVSQINVKVSKAGSKKLADLLGAPDAKAEDGKEPAAEEKKETPKAEEKKEAPKAEKPVEKVEAKADKPAQTPKAEEKPEVKTD